MSGIAAPDAGVVYWSATQMETAAIHKLLGKSFIHTFLFSLLPALNPFYAKPDLTPNPSIIGAYAPEPADEPIVSAYNRELLQISKSTKTPGAYKLSLMTRGETTDFTARLFQLSSATYMDLTPHGKQYPFPHAAIRVEFQGDTLTFYNPTQEQLLKKIAHIPSKLPPGRQADCERYKQNYYAAGSFCTKILTVPTKDLQAFLKEGIEGKPFPLYRVVLE